MQVSEYKLSMNNNMNPQEAATEAQKFVDSSKDDNYDGPQEYNDSQFFDDGPPEPAEPKFPNF